MCGRGRVGGWGGFHTATWFEKALLLRRHKSRILFLPKDVVVAVRPGPAPFSWA